MIDHVLSVRGQARPSPYGGVAVAYACSCGRAFISEAPEPVCPAAIDYAAGRRAGRADKAAKRRRVQESWMTAAYRKGYLSGRGQQLKPSEAALPPPSLEPVP